MLKKKKKPLTIGESNELLQYNELIILLLSIDTIIGQLIHFLDSAYVYRNEKREISRQR